MQVMPRSLALGAAAGVFVAILPIPGVQLLSAAGLAWLIRGHSGTAALATFAANPVTYPLIWLASYTLGATILGTSVSQATHDLDLLSDMMARGWATSTATPGGFRSVVTALTTLAVGAIPLALVSATAAYVGVRRMLRRRDGHVQKIVPDAAPAAPPAPFRAPSRRPPQMTTPAPKLAA